MKFVSFQLIIAILLFSSIGMAISPDLLNLDLMPEAIAEDDLEQYLEEFINHPLLWTSCGVDEIAKLPLAEDLIDRLIAVKKNDPGLADWRSVQVKGKFSRKEIRAVRLFFRFSSGNRDRAIRFQNYTSIKNTHTTDMYRQLMRGGVHCGPRLEMGFIAENDPGEKQLWDYRNFSLTGHSLSGDWTMGLSAYKLGWGHGLLFSRRNLSLKGSSISANILAGSPRVRAYTGSGENRFLQGIYLQKDWRRLSLFSGVSRRRLDATIQDSMVVSFRETGSHSSPAELAAKDTLREDLLCTGSIFSYEWFEGGFLLFDSRYTYPVRDFTKGFRQRGASVFHRFHSGDWHISGELATLNTGEFAVIQGFVFRSAVYSLGIQYRYYSDDFGTRLSSSIKEYSSDTGNEKGFLIGFKGKINKHNRVTGYIDYFSENRSFEDAIPPAFGNEAVVSLYHRGPAKQRLRIRIKREVKSAGFEKYQSSLTSHWVLPMNLSLSLRGVMNSVNDQYGAAYSVAISSEALHMLAFTIGTTQFYSPVYAARVYLYEPGIPRRFNVISAYGTGFRLFMLLEKEFANGLELALSWKQQYRRSIEEADFRKTFLLEFQMLVDL